MCALFSMIIIKGATGMNALTDLNLSGDLLLDSQFFLFFSYLLLGPSICFSTLCSRSPCPVGDSNHLIPG